MGYKIYIKDDKKGRYSRFEQWDGKTYASRSNAQKALVKAKQLNAKYVKASLARGNDFYKNTKVRWEIRSDGKTMKKKPARRGGFTGEGFGEPLGTFKFRGFM
jgi:hypothetical protein